MLASPTPVVRVDDGHQFLEQTSGMHGHLAGGQVLCKFTDYISPLLDADDNLFRLRR